MKLSVARSTLATSVKGSSIRLPMLRAYPAWPNICAVRDQNSDFVVSEKPEKAMLRLA